MRATRETYLVHLCALALFDPCLSQLLPSASSRHSRADESSRKLEDSYPEEVLPELSFLEQLSNFYGPQLVFGIKFQEEQEPRYFETVANTREWQLTTAHAIVKVNLTELSAQKLKTAATKLMNVEIIDLLWASEASATVETLPLMKEVKVITVTPECEAFSWNQTSALAFANSIRSRVGKPVALSLSAAMWKATQDKAGEEVCSDWTDSTSVIMGCVNQGKPLERCRAGKTTVVDNVTIVTMVNYARSKDLNAFCIRSAQIIEQTLALKLQFHLLNFTLPSRQGIPLKETRQRSIQLGQPGAHDWASCESGEKTVPVDSSSESEVELVETEDTVVATEHHVKSGVVKKASSKPADSASSLPVSAWRGGPSSSSAAGTEGSNESPTEKAQNPIKKAPAPSSDMVSAPLTD
ncbi:uncharacterized protein LOC125941089 [Dermacentor silvarum]|uniref:uncharacterized protein LOC125941089 n=1 Tax=Dermacentor silvarum TaxID=543639 RepID=UPI0021013BDD|nr:uncharacterized protein LOC125941089 [Dermacentor silvarum]